MKLDKIKNTVTWKWLVENPRFEEEFEKAIRRCGYHIDLSKLNIEIGDKKIKISYVSDIINRDLDSQYKMFKSVEFSRDENNNLIINEASGKLETNRGHNFTNTEGGKLITNYSCQVYDESGIELSYQSYCDEYSLGSEVFNYYIDNLESVVFGKYDPQLIKIVDQEKPYVKPMIIGSNARFLRKARSRYNLGLVEVSRSIFNGSNVETFNEYYFNTSYGKNPNSPELIHFMEGFPFAILDGSHKLVIQDNYGGCNLTSENYQDVARERLLTELINERKKQSKKDFQVVSKYDMMIERVERELGRTSKKL